MAGHGSHLTNAEAIHMKENLLGFLQRLITAEVTGCGSEALLESEDGTATMSAGNVWRIEKTYRLMILVQTPEGRNNVSRMQHLCNVFVTRAACFASF